MKGPFIFFLTILFAHTTCNSRKEESKPEAQTEEVKTVNEYPDLVLRLTDGNDVRTRTLQGNNVFVFFQPDCDHCQEEAIQIQQRLDEFKDYTLYFISSAPLEHISRFAENFHLHDKPQVKFAWTATEGVLNHYGPIQTPSLYIYSKGRLKQSFNGQTDLDEILAAL